MKTVLGTTSLMTLGTIFFKGTFQTACSWRSRLAMLPVCSGMATRWSGSQSNWSIIQEPLTAMVLLSTCEGSFGSLVSNIATFASKTRFSTSSPIPTQHQRYPMLSQHEGMLSRMNSPLPSEPWCPSTGVAGVLGASVFHSFPGPTSIQCSSGNQGHHLSQVGDSP